MGGHTPSKYRALAHELWWGGRAAQMAKSRFPRATVKKIVKQHAPEFRQQKNLDLLVFLDYLLFLKDVAAVSEAQAKQAGDKVVRAAHVNKVVQVCLKRFRA